MNQRHPGKGRTQRTADWPKQEAAYQRLRRDIIGLQLEPGQMLSDRGLVRQLGVSRTPIREALRRLSQEGLVEWRPPRGVVVSEIRLHEVLELMRIRAVLETLAVRLAAPRIERDDLALMTHEFEEILETKVEVREALRRGERLHVAIIRASGDETLGRLLSQVRERLRRAQEFAWSRWRAVGDFREPQRRKAEEHLSIVRALLKREGEAAAHAMEAHIMGARADYVRLVTGTNLSELDDRRRMLIDSGSPVGPDGSLHRESGRMTDDGRGTTGKGSESRRGRRPLGRN